mgnify:CR=1 FL=1
MDKRAAIGVVFFLLVSLGGFFVWQKSQIKPVEIPAKESMIKKVDLSTQPDWVQKLKVVAKKGVSGNGLANVTIYIDGMPKDMVSALSYVVQYQTSNKGTQGAFSTTPLKINGATTFSKTIDLGTCSTKSCVRHDGVTSVEVELNFTTTSGDTSVWTGTINL